MRHHAAFGRRSWSRRSMTQNLRTNLFSVGVFAHSTIDQWVSFFHFLFHFLTFIARCALWSLVVSPAILVVRPLLLFILRSSEFVSVAVQSVSCFERLVKQPWFPSSDSILIVPFSYITTLQRKKKIGADRGGHWTPPARRKGASDSTTSLTSLKVCQ